MMGVREIDRFLEQWQIGIRDLHRRTILAPTPKERDRWHATWLLVQGWTASATAEALDRDPHTIGRWAAAFSQSPRPPAADHPIWQNPFLCKIGQNSSFHTPAFCTVLATRVKFSHYPLPRRSERF